ncbi:MAG: FliO/MopB family protein [Fibrobacter sp.]|nr:FliO/MopB family protein [Fibrobacter sp.]
MYKKVQIISLRLFLPVLLLLSVCYAQNQQSETGNFDFDKLQEAISNQSDSQGTENQAVEQNVKKDSDNYVWVVFRITLYLAIVIGVIFLVAWIVRKAGIGNSRIGGSGNMDILEVLQTGQNRNIMIVRVMDVVYLVGQTQNSIALLEKIEGQKAIDLIASSKGGGTVMQFKEVFNNFMGKMKKPV